MLWLLDTCVVSELIRKKPDAVVVHWLQNYASESVLCAVTIGEIQHGLQRLPVGKNRNRLQVWFDGLCADYADRTLPTDLAVWRVWGSLKASLETIGRPQEDMDILIAAVAAHHRLTVVTRNIRHFEDTGVATVNPWLTPA